MVDGFVPKDLAEALKIKAAHPETVWYAGGTDLMVDPEPDATYLFVGKLDELRRVREDDEYVRIGAAVTFTEGLRDPLVPQVMKDALALIAAPAIRNAGTFGGNIGNGSAKADSVLVDYALDARVRVLSASGERVVPITELYLGRKRLDLAPDEIVAEVLLPKADIGPYLYQKVGGRRALAISRVSFCGVLRQDGGRIAGCTAAFGAVADTVLRFPDLESHLVGMTVGEARAAVPDLVCAYGDRLKLTRGRVSAEYRKQVCLNLLGEFFSAMGL
ncbi:FAD binding domain-containing protein [Atopobiaceae bacterium 24-176]